MSERGGMAFVYAEIATYPAAFSFVLSKGAERK
jgi:hypothetical protein